MKGVTCFLLICQKHKRQIIIQTGFKALVSDYTYYVCTRTYSVVFVELPLFYISLLLLPGVVSLMFHVVSGPSVGSCLHWYTSGELMSRMPEIVRPVDPESDNP
jgi:hypothetical protein